MNIMSFPSELLVILLGVLVYYMYTCIDNGGSFKSPKWFSVSVATFALFLMASFAFNENYFLFFNNIFSFGVLFAMFLFSQLVYSLKVFNNRLLALIGKHSYGIYLSHIIILKYMNDYLGRYKQIRLWRDLIGYFILVLASIIVSCITEKVLDQKLVHGIKRCMGR